MKIDFSSPVIRHCFSLRCLPFDTPSQRIELINVDIEPHNMLTETADGFGNRVLTDRIIEPHSKFVAIVEGKASLDFSKREKEELNCIYKYPSQHTVPGEKSLNSCRGSVIWQTLLRLRPHRRFQKESAKYSAIKAA